MSVSTSSHPAHPEFKKKCKKVLQVCATVYYYTLHLVPIWGQRGRSGCQRIINSNNKRVWVRNRLLISVQIL